MLGSIVIVNFTSLFFSKKQKQKTKENVVSRFLLFFIVFHPAISNNFHFKIR